MSEEGKINVRERERERERERVRVPSLSYRTALIGVGYVHAIIKKDSRFCFGWMG